MSYTYHKTKYVPDAQSFVDAMKFSKQTKLLDIKYAAKMMRCDKITSRGYHFFYRKFIKLIKGDV